MLTFLALKNLQLFSRKITDIWSKISNFSPKMAYFWSNLTRKNLQLPKMSIFDQRSPTFTRGVATGRIMLTGMITAPPPVSKIFRNSVLNFPCKLYRYDSLLSSLRELNCTLIKFLSGRDQTPKGLVRQSGPFGS